MFKRLARPEEDMRPLVFCTVLFALLFVLSCGKADQPQQMPTVTPGQQATEPQAQLPWFIESYDNGVITVRHDGKVYKASCVETSSYAKDFANVTRSPNCNLGIELVGHEVKAFGAQVSPDANGRTIVALNVGERLVFRMWHDNDPGLRDEEFKITSVSRSQR
jgi:hypothetical protein